MNSLMTVVGLIEFANACPHAVLSKNLQLETAWEPTIWSFSMSRAAEKDWRESFRTFWISSL